MATDPRLRAAMQPYIAMMRSYLENSIDGSRLADRYSERYLSDDFMWPDDVFRQLDAVFAVAEEFEADPLARAELVMAASDEDMHRVVSNAYAALTALIEAPQSA